MDHAWRNNRVACDFELRKYMKIYIKGKIWLLSLKVYALEGVNKNGLLFMAIGKLAISLTFVLIRYLPDASMDIGSLFFQDV